SYSRVRRSYRSSRLASRACSDETAAARCWSSQNPGCPSSSSSSASRVLSRSGSKVTTDPVELGPDLLQLLLDRELAFVGHRGADGTGGCRQGVPAAAARPRSVRPTLPPTTSMRPSVNASSSTGCRGQLLRQASIVCAYVRGRH